MRRDSRGDLRIVDLALCRGANETADRERAGGGGTVGKKLPPGHTRRRLLRHSHRLVGGLGLLSLNLLSLNLHWLCLRCLSLRGFVRHMAHSTQTIVTAGPVRPSIVYSLDAPPRRGHR